MKSYGQLWERIVSEDALLAAWKRVRRGHAKSVAVMDFEKDLLVNLVAIRDDLLSGTYEPGDYRQFGILDPKPRTISCAPIRDRVVHHALCGAITPLLERSFIHTSFACRVGYGSHRACALARRYAKRYRYFCKMDIRHYFDTISHDRLLDVLLPKFREERVKDLIRKIVDHPVPGQSPQCGLPIGNLTSQWFANAFLDEFDHAALAGFGKCGSVAYIRYMDDFLFFSEAKAKAWEFHDSAKQWLEMHRGLAVKGEVTVVGPVSEGVPFLGLRIFPNCWRLRRERFVRSRQTYRHREHQLGKGEISERMFSQCVASCDGSLRWFGFKGILASGNGAASGSNRVQRGGNWNNDNNNNFPSSNRNNNNNPSNRNNNYGFRLGSTPAGCKGPARDAGAQMSSETNMHDHGRLVATRERRAEVYCELGSGVRNLYRFTKLYSGATPLFEEDDIFRITVPLVGAAKDATLNATLNEVAHVATNVALNVAIKLSAQEQAIVRQIQKNDALSQVEIAERLHLSRQHVNRIVGRLKSLNVIVREGSKKTGHWKIVKGEP